MARACLSSGRNAGKSDGFAVLGRRELASAVETDQDKVGPGRKQGEEAVAAKHDGKHARANLWVTQQNLMKQKGGRPGYQFKERKLPKVAKPEPVQAAREADEPEVEPATSPAASQEVPSTKG